MSSRSQRKKAWNRGGIVLRGDFYDPGPYRLAGHGELASLREAVEAVRRQFQTDSTPHPKDADDAKTTAKT